MKIQALILISSLMLISCSSKDEAPSAPALEQSNSAPSTPVIEVVPNDKEEEQQEALDGLAAKAQLSVAMNRSARAALYHKRDWTMQEQIDFALSASLINLRAVSTEKNVVIFRAEAGEYATFSASHMETTYRLLGYQSEREKFNQVGSYKQKKTCASEEIDIGSEELVNDEYVPAGKKIFIDGHAQNIRRKFEVKLTQSKAELSMTLIHTECTDSSIGGSDKEEFERAAATYALEVKCHGSWSEGAQEVKFSKCDILSKHAKVNYDYHRVFNHNVKMSFDQEIESLFE